MLKFEKIRRQKVKGAWITETALLLEGSQASPVCPSDNNNMQKKMNMKHCWDYNEFGKTVYRGKNLTQ